MHGFLPHGVTLDLATQNVVVAGTVFLRQVCAFEVVVDDASVESQPEFVAAVAAEVLDVRQRHHGLHGAVVHVAGLVAVEGEPDADELLPPVALIDRAIDFRADGHERFAHGHPLRPCDDRGAHDAVEGRRQRGIGARGVGVELREVVVLGGDDAAEQAQCPQ